MTRPIPSAPAGLETRQRQAFSPAPAPAPSAPADALWRLRLLGGFELEDGEQRLTRLRTRAAALLLARLAMAPARAHAREELATLLWPEADQAVSRSRLRQTLSYLRSLLEPAGSATVLVADRRVVHVAQNTLWCDVTAFEEAVRSRRRSEARAHYRGELLPGFYDEWVHDERQRLDALAGRIAELPEAEPDAAPATSTATASPAVPPTPTTPRTSRLPQYLTRLIGADLSGARLRDNAREHRLVTVLGAGGSGKTRLAVEVARLLSQPSPTYPTPAFERAVFVSLVDCTGALSMLDRVSSSLGLGAGDAATRIVDALDGQCLLVVLDNTEQLDAGAINAVASLIGRLPAAHWLVTSRRPLGLDGERCFALEALELPVGDASLNEAALNPAVALFVDRARAHRIEFQVTPGNRDGLVALVRWLGGLPLAIELAASRSRTLRPAEMLALLRGAEGDAQAGPAALAWLSRRGPRGGDDPRQASMLAVVDWSWQLLDAAGQRMLRTICAHPVGADVEACAAIGAPGDAPATVQATLDALVACSVATVRAGQDGRLRYQATEPVRHYVVATPTHAAAAEQRAALRARALDWAEALPATPPLATVREELPNLLAVLRDAVSDGAGADAVRLILAMSPSWGEIALPEGALQVLGQVLQAPDLDPELLAQGHAVAAWSAQEAGQREAALEHARRALAPALADAGVRATVLSRVARVRWRIERDAAATRRMLAEALPLARASGRFHTEAALLSLESHLAAYVDRDATGGAALAAEAMVLWRRTGNAHLVNAGRYNEASQRVIGGRPAEALAELLALAEDGIAGQDWDLAAGALDAAGTALLALRRHDESAAVLRRSLALAWDAMEPTSIVHALWNIAPALARQRRGSLAAETMGFAELCWLRRFGDINAADRRDLLRVRRFVHRLMPVDEAEAAWARGARRSLAEAVRAVLEA